MDDDSELLSRYCRERSEAAFAELVHRHLKLVYFAAVRQVGGNRQLAEEISQQVFLELVKKAPALVGRTSLAGWLYTCARYVAIRVRRSEQRRSRREAQAGILMETTSSDPAETAIDPAAHGALLNDALGIVSDRDRELILLRYFRSLSFPEIGQALRLSPDAARLRLDRALERIRTKLARRGIQSSAGALALAFTAEAALPMPATLAPVIVGAGMAAQATTLGTAASLLQTFMSTSSAKIAVASAVGLIAAATATDVAQLVRTHRLRSQLAALQAEHGHPRPAHRAAAVAGPAANRQAADLQRKAPIRKPAAAAASAAGLPPGMTAMSALANAGTDTPFATVETALWARYNANADTLADMIRFAPDAQKASDALWAGLSPSVRRQYPSPEALMGLYIAKNFAADWAGYQVTEDRQNGPMPDLWLVQFQYETADGATKPGGLALQQVDGAWKMLIGAGTVKRLAAYLAGSK